MGSSSSTMKNIGGRTMTLSTRLSNNEAYEFLTLYKNEQNLTEPWLTARMAEVMDEGEYVPTTEELIFGARVAWRNSNKCIGRLFWHSLHVFDERKLKDEHAIFQALLRHIQYATNNGKIRPAITVFSPGKVRIWNKQLLHYAGYETVNGIVGDPDSVAFTKVCQELGWQGEGTAFDILPLVIQIEEREPQVFTIPKEYVLEVNITHPEYEKINELQLKWYAVPIISSMRFNCGGIDYEAAPFNGWYMGTEIGARNFADENRYNYLPAIAEAIGIEHETNSSLWKDRALLELNISVLHSYKEAGVSIVDHHTAAQQFKLFQQQEENFGREVTGNWTWLIPPMSPATTHIFHQPFSNVILKPNYFYQKLPF